MSSLTPETRSVEATEESLWEGYVNGFMALVASTGGVYLATKYNKTFAGRTNLQSRTAIAIMPALFVFAFTSERRLDEKMRQIASETEHTHKVVEWTEEQTKDGKNASVAQVDKELLDLYKKSVADSGVRIVPDLSWYHRAANFTAENPVKVLGTLAVPAVASIYYGRTGKEHMEMSVKLMHTRVFGQFTTLSLFFSVIAFKEFMDRNGKFISQDEADARVYEMQRARKALMAKLQYEKEQQEAYQREIALAHEQDIQDHKKHKKEKKQHSEEKKA